MDEAQTPQEFFNTVLPNKFKPEKATGVDVVAQIHIAGPDGGDWVVTIKKQKLQVKEGTDPASNLTLKMNYSDFMDMVNNRLSAEKAFFTGKIQFKGNIALALKLKEAGFL
jgi:putative sterol carrier protein